MLTRKRPRASAFEAWQMMVDAHGASALSDIAMVGPGTTYKWSDPDQPTKGVPLAVAAAVTRATGDPTLAEFLAGCAGGMFVPLPEKGAQPSAQMATAFIETSSAVAAELVRGLTDTDLLAADKAALWAALQPHIRLVAELRALCVPDVAE